MKHFYTFFCLILFTAFSWGQQATIFSETLDINTTPSGGQQIENTNFDNSDLTFTGNADTRTTGSSDGQYEGASGGRNVFFGTGGSINDRNITISGINTEEFTNYQLSFGMNSNADQSLKLEYSTDGDSFSEITFPAPADSGWKLVSIENIALPSSASLTLRFSKNDGTTYRLDDVLLTGEPLVPVITSSTSSLSDFNYIEGNGPSAPQSFAISGQNLDESDVMASVPEISSFEISDSQEGTFGQTITLSSFDGEETEIYLRLKEGLAPDMYSDEMTISGGGADEVTVDVYGKVTEEVFLIYEFTGEVLTPAQSPMGATTSEFQVTGTTPTFSDRTQDNWTGSGVPVAQSGSDWGTDNPDDAKYFFFTVDADTGFEMDLTFISFEWRVTNAGPSAITVEINGTEIQTFDAPNNETTVFTAPLTSFENLSEIEVRIKGWDNGSRSTSGGGIFRVNDVRLDGEIYATTSVLVANPTEITGLEYIEGNGPSASQSFLLSGIDVDGSDVTASLPQGSSFEISDSEEGIYGESVNLVSFDGSETLLYVRLKEALQPDNYMGNLTLTGGGADPITVSLSGKVKDDLFVVYEFTGETPAPTQFPENAMTSDFLVSADGPVNFGNAQADTWTAGSGVPYANSRPGWDATSAADAKYFSFTITADEGYSIDLSFVAFEYRVTGNGPSAITVEINGDEVETFSTEANETKVFAAPISGKTDLSEVEVRIKGWLDGSNEDSDGTGFFRINDVSLDGTISETLNTVDFETAESFQLYPNPSTNGQFNIRAQGFSAGDVNLKIYNLVGQQVYAKTHQTSSDIVVNSELKTGVYIVELSQADKRFTKKLIIK